MFCPSCGLKEDRPVQFCRACGTDLRAVRSSVEQPDLIMASSTAAREEIGRAIAAKIKDVKKLNELEDILPEIEKFLESPQDRRLRRLRAGVITAAIGLGATLFFLMLGLAEKDLFFLTSLGVVLFLIGLGIVVNGLAFTVPKQYTVNNSLSDTSVSQGILPPAQSSTIPVSVTENTTRQLSK